MFRARLSIEGGSYAVRNIEPQGGWFSALASMVGNMFVADEKQIAAVRSNDSILLALYEAIHLNRNFITALTHTHTPSTPATPPSSPVLSPGNPLLNQVPKTDPALLEPTCQPTNLLVTFLEYSSVVLQDTKDVTQHNNAKLCLIILTCISEDQYANSLMHDINMNFRVPLHRMVYLMVEFIMSHMMKTFPLELYLKCLGITHRVLCYQKKCRVRIQYPWKELWTALINLLKFILSNEGSLVKRQNNIFHLSSKIMNIFNTFITYGDTFLPNPNSYDELYYEIIRMHQVFDNIYSMDNEYFNTFITYGDTFLPNPNSYDELYYEIIRMHQVFDNIYSMALRYTTNDGESKDSAARLTNHLVNIRAIVNHFTPKVDAWSAAKQLSSLTEEQVLEVVRANYDTLTLKLQDNLDQFDRYSEKPREMGYFTQLVRSITVEVRKTTNSIWTTQTEVLHSLSSIT
ncbi:Armadillo-like helical domain-containing protein 3 [Mytilus coruscus]|uniref:Armadillo-like helical domain-containing protein 3 n=1 Tax=Mytilus coruscus TaxID=42192 RepID=A0A6J8ECZ4_MYTCO|nr:Armadillo-like helical domain-containing protein 3 [Mytilus coruscus]